MVLTRFGRILIRSVLLGLTLIGVGGTPALLAQAPITVSIEDLSFEEGNPGGAVTQKAIVKLSAITTRPVTVTVEAAPGVGTAAPGDCRRESGKDYSFPSRTVTIERGQAAAVTDLPFVRASVADGEVLDQPYGSASGRAWR